MEQLVEILTRLENRGDLSDEDLTDIEAQLSALVDEIGDEEITADVVEALDQIATAVEGIRDERAARAEAASKLTAEAEALLRRISGEPETAEDETDEEESEEAEDETEEAAEAESEDPEPEAEEPKEAEVVAASARKRAKGARVSSIREHQPREFRTKSDTPNGRPAPRLIAAPDLRQYHSGEVFRHGWADAAQAMSDLLEDTRGAHSGAPIKRRVATLDWKGQYPDNRHLVAGADVERNTAMIRELVDPVLNNSSALIAAGGLCAPLDVRYDVVDMTTAERPLRGALPAMRADRGGLRWMPSPTLGDMIIDNTGGAIDTTTVANDLANATKTVQEFTCPSEQTAQVTAISERLQFGNFADRYWPENVAAVMSTARAAHSRHAERLLLEAMRSASTLLNANAGANPMGGFPKFLGVIRTAARHYRYQFRLGEDAPLRLVLPSWLLDVLAMDIMFQEPGDDLTGTRINIASIVSGQLADINVSPIYQRDDARTNDANGAGAPAFTVQAAGSLTDYPGRVSALLFHEGAFLFLDGGTLDFGIVRDSTLNTSNRWQTFFETFEAVAMVGLASWNITIEMCATGSRAALVTSDCNAVGS